MAFRSSHDGSLTSEQDTKQQKDTRISKIKDEVRLRIRTLMKARESLNEGNNVVKSCSTRDQTTHQSIIEQLETKIVLEQLMHLLQSQDISKVKDLSEIIAKLSQKRHELN